MRIVFSALLFFFSIALSAREEPHSSLCESYFSPEDNVASRLIELIKAEKKSIKIAIYSLRHRGIVNALIEAKKRGIVVEMIVDPISVKGRSPLKRLSQEGVAIFVWNAQQVEGQFSHKSKKRELMHHKFCLFHEELVWTGSFNFTYEADRSNHENAVVLHDEEGARKFVKEFEHLKKGTCLPYEQFIALQNEKKSKKL